MILKIIIIFIAGIIIDLLVTRYTSSVANKKITQATILTGLITMSNFLFLTVILKESTSDGLFNILAFAGGNSLGTFIAMIKR